MSWAPIGFLQPEIWYGLASVDFRYYILYVLQRSSLYKKCRQHNFVINDILCSIVDHIYCVISSYYQLFEYVIVQYLKNYSVFTAVPPVLLLSIPSWCKVGS